MSYQTYHPLPLTHSTKDSNFTNMEDDYKLPITRSSNNIRSDANIDIEKFDQENEIPLLPLPLQPKVPLFTPAVSNVNDPKSWSFFNKLLATASLCSFSFALTYSSTAYIASIPNLEAKYNISLEVSLLGVALTVLGFSAGPLLWGASSELFGRRKVYIFTGFFFAVFAWAAVYASDAASLIIFRFFVGFFGSSSLNNTPASIADFTSPSSRGPYTAAYAFSAFSAAAFGLLCSSFIQVYLGYEWNLRIIAILCTVTALSVATIPETHASTLAKWKAKSDPNTIPPSTPSVGQVLTIYNNALLLPIEYLFLEPVATLACFYLAILYGCMYGFFEAFELVYVEARGFSQTSYGLTYISLILGILFGSILMATIANTLYMRESRAATALGEKTRPESRLHLSYVGAFLFPLSLFLFAGTASEPSISWVVPCFAEFLFGLSLLCVFAGFIPYLIEVYLKNAASAMAASGASRSLIGGIFPLFSLQMYEALKIPGATGLLGGIALCLLPIPFIFRRYGEALRIRSKHAAA